MWQKKQNRFDKNDQFIWDSWKSFYVERKRIIKQWFPRDCNKDFENLFPKFWQKYNHPQWNDVLKKALNWYIETNKLSINIEGSIALQQVALEMLANFKSELTRLCVYLVVLNILFDHIDENLKLILFNLLKYQIYKEKKYNKKDAKSKIRKLLKDDNLPLEIPDHLTNLKKIEESQTYNKLNDSPAIFVQIRKSIVHDTSDNQANVENILNNLNISKEDVILETYTFGQWLLEIILLKIFDYEGNYVNRTNPQSNRSDGEPFTF